LGYLARYDFKHNGKRACVFHCFRIVDQLLRRSRSLALHAVSAELIDRLRRQADMAHHADLFVHEALHEVNALVSAFELDCFRAAFLNESQRVSHGVVIARVESSIRHVRDEQARCTARRTAFK
jgi:hypothetical protein